ncbi:hypothetical protein [Chryseobacterium foetidum]|uniref:hypothetical protein n=1 Tax=Chryseobacterium foetidum TaxID=2951057 RepID=UPI0021C8C359|nr:hypothetical protein [Chryseobacterium foetidum]
MKADLLLTERISSGSSNSSNISALSVYPRDYLAVVVLTNFYLCTSYGFKD